MTTGPGSNSSPRLLSPMVPSSVLAAERAEAEADAKLLAEIRYYWIDLFAEDQRKVYDLAGSSEFQPVRDVEKKGMKRRTGNSTSSSRDAYLATTYPGIASIKGAFS